MPKVSEFFGIAIYLYYRDHQPPHFHALYAGQEVQIVIESLAALKGELPPRAMGLVMEWAQMHRAELARDWAQAQAHQPLDSIPPLV
jgi:hypothetical protein